MPLRCERRKGIVDEIQIVLDNFRMHDPNWAIFAQESDSNRVDQWLKFHHFYSLVENEQSSIYRYFVWQQDSPKFYLSPTTLQYYFSVHSASMDCFQILPYIGYDFQKIPLVSLCLNSDFVGQQIDYAWLRAK